MTRNNIILYSLAAIFVLLAIFISMRISKRISKPLTALAEETVKDLHDVAQNIIIPKFFWLKVAYGSFFVGNVIAISITMVSISTSS